MGSDPLFFIDFLDYLKSSVRVSRSMNDSASEKSSTPTWNNGGQRRDNSSAWGNANGQRRGATNQWNSGGRFAARRPWIADVHSGGNKFADANSGSRTRTVPQAEPKNTEIRNENIELCSELFCNLCEKAHGLMDCETFAGLNPDGRTDVCFRNKICFKCLRPGHLASRCVARIRCTECGGPHHFLLHGSTPPVAARNGGRPAPTDTA